MTDLNTILHDTNWARVTITRIGDSRNTQYQVQQLEADMKTDAPLQQLRIQNRLALLNYDSGAAVESSDFLRRKYGHHDSDQTKE